MATSFPTGLDAIQRVVATDLRNAPGKEGHALHNNVCDAIEALQAKVGVDGSTVPTSIDKRLADTEAASADHATRFDAVEATAAEHETRLRNTEAAAIGYQVTNIQALFGVSKKLAAAEYSNVVINVLGDSITYGTYSNGTALLTDANADVYGYVGRLRAKLARLYGKDPGGFIPANHSANVLSGTGSPVSSIGMPQTCVRVAGTTVPHALPLPSGATITIPVPRCTDIEIWYFDSNTVTNAGAIANTGTFSYNVDSAGATTTTADNANPVAYKKIAIAGLAASEHSLVLTGVSGTCYILGVFYFSAAGCVSVNKFGIGSGTSLDFTGESSQNFISAAGRQRAWGFVGAAKAPTTLTGSVTNGSNSVTGLSSTSGLSVGMIVGSATNLPLPCYITEINSSTAISLSAAATGTSASQSLIFGGNEALTGDIYIICIGHNDWTHQNDAISTTPEVMKTRLQLLIDIFTAKGAAILLVGSPRANNTVTPETYTIEDYWTALDELAEENANVCTMQISSIWGTHAEAVTAGFVSVPSGVHPLARGASHMAQAIYNVLTMCPGINA